MTRLESCCRSCGCGVVVCLDHWPPTSCLHGLAICGECRPGECAECGDEVAREVAA